MNDHVNPLFGDILGAALNPGTNAAKLAAMTWKEPTVTENDRLATLRAAVRAAYSAWQEMEDRAAPLRARYYALSAEVSEAEGDELFARWHRALAVNDHATCDECARLVKERQERDARVSGGAA